MIPYSAALPTVTKSLVVLDSTFKDTTRPNRPCWSNWIMRNYAVPAAIIVNSDFGYDDYTFDTASEPVPNSNPPQTRCIPGTSGPRWRTWQAEHCVYNDLYGPGHIVGNTFRRMGGRGVYIAYRPFTFQQYPPDNPPMSQDNHFLYDNNHCLDLDQDAGRGAFNLTFFDYGDPAFPSTIVVRNSTFLGRTPFFRRRNSNEKRPLSDTQAIANPQEWVRSNGGIVFTNYEFGSRPAVPDPGNPYVGLTGFGGSAGDFDNPGYDPATDDHICAKMVIQNNLFHYTRMEKPVIKVDGVGELIIENCVFINDSDVGETNVMEIRLNDERFDAFLPQSGFGSKPITTIRLRNCITVGPVVMTICPADATQYSQRVTIDANCPGRQRVYNANGALQSDAVFSVANSYNPATDLNSLDPWDAIDEQSYTRTYSFPGVTV